MLLSPSDSDLELPTDAEVRESITEAHRLAHPLTGFGFAVPPMTNVYSEKTAFEWYVLRDDCISVEVDSCNTNAWGSPPDWLNDYWDGLDYAMLGHGEERHLRFMLEHGIGLGQPFLVELDKPTYSRDYWTGEGDVHLDFEIVRVMPRRRPHLGIERFLRRRAAYKVERAAKLARLIAAQKKRFDTLYVSAHHVVPHFDADREEEYRLDLFSNLRWPSTYNPNPLISVRAPTRFEADRLLFVRAAEEGMGDILVDRPPYLWRS